MHQNPKSRLSEPHTATALPRKSGWTPERRARQAARIRLWAPWAKSTGPETVNGKSKSAANSYKHGHRARNKPMIIKVLSAQSQFLRHVNHYIRLLKIQATNELLVPWEKRLLTEGRAVSAMLVTALAADGMTHYDHKSVSDFFQKG